MPPELSELLRQGAGFSHELIDFRTARQWGHAVLIPIGVQVFKRANAARGAARTITVSIAQLQATRSEVRA